jgi:hypothetical protein
MSAFRAILLQAWTFYISLKAKKEVVQKFCLDKKQKECIFADSIVQPSSCLDETYKLPSGSLASTIEPAKVLLIKILAFRILATPFCTDFLV